MKRLGEHRYFVAVSPIRRHLLDPQRRKSSIISRPLEAGIFCSARSIFSMTTRTRGTGGRPREPATGTAVNPARRRQGQVPKGTGQGRARTRPDYGFGFFSGGEVEKPNDRQPEAQPTSATKSTGVPDHFNCLLGRGSNARRGSLGQRTAQVRSSQRIRRFKAYAGPTAC